MTGSKVYLASMSVLLLALGLWLGSPEELSVWAEGGAPGSAPTDSQPAWPSTPGGVVYMPLINRAPPEKISFERRQDPRYEIFVMNPDGSGQVNLTNHPANDTGPAWSPDGLRIAFVSERYDGNDELYHMNRDGSGIVRLTYDPGSDRWPTWSPDGTQIAFQSDRSGNWDIYVMNADGSNQRPITDDPRSDRWPDWSPDGTKITFTSRRIGVNTKVFVMNPDGRNVTVLSDPGGYYDDRYSTWSPDGRITFVSDQPSPIDGSRDDEIYIMSAWGHNVRQLTHNGAIDWLARWSPQGTRFAFYSDRDGNKNIYVKTLATGEETRITEDPRDEEYPAWSP
jgi:Tol biopolymer transport system component